MIHITEEPRIQSEHENSMQEHRNVDCACAHQSKELKCWVRDDENTTFDKVPSTSPSVMTGFLSDLLSNFDCDRERIDLVTDNPRSVKESSKPFRIRRTHSHNHIALMGGSKHGCRWTNTSTAQKKSSEDSAIIPGKLAPYHFSEHDHQPLRIVTPTQLIATDSNRQSIQRLGVSQRRKKRLPLDILSSKDRSRILPAITCALTTSKSVHLRSRCPAADVPPPKKSSLPSRASDGDLSKALISTIEQLSRRAAACMVKDQRGRK